MIIGLPNDRVIYSWTPTLTESILLPSLDYNNATFTNTPYNGSTSVTTSATVSGPGVYITSSETTTFNWDGTEYGFYLNVPELLELDNTDSGYYILLSDGNPADSSATTGYGLIISDAGDSTNRLLVFGDLFGNADLSTQSTTITPVALQNAELCISVQSTDGLSILLTLYIDGIQSIQATITASASSTNVGNVDRFGAYMFNGIQTPSSLLFIDTPITPVNSVNQISSGVEATPPTEEGVYFVTGAASDFYLNDWLLTNGSTFTVDASSNVVERTVPGDFDFNEDHEYNGEETFENQAIFNSLVKDKQYVNLDYNDVAGFSLNPYTKYQFELTDSNPVVNNVNFNFYLDDNVSSDYDSAGRPCYYEVEYTTNTSTFGSVSLYSNNNIYINGADSNTTVYVLKNKSSSFKIIRFTTDNGEGRWNVITSDVKSLFNYQSIEGSTLANGSHVVYTGTNNNPVVYLSTGYQSGYIQAGESLTGVLNITSLVGGTTIRNANSNVPPGTTLSILSGEGGWILLDSTSAADFVYYPVIADNKFNTIEYNKNTSLELGRIGGADDVSAYSNVYIANSLDTFSNYVRRVDGYYNGSTLSGVGLSVIEYDNENINTSYNGISFTGHIDKSLNVNGLNLETRYVSGVLSYTRALIQNQNIDDNTGPYINLYNDADTVNGVNSIFISPSSEAPTAPLTLAYSYDDSTMSMTTVVDVRDDQVNTGYTLSVGNTYGVSSDIISMSATGPNGDFLLAASGNIKMTTLPTSDPGIIGALWNDSGTLKVST